MIILYSILTVVFWSIGLVIMWWIKEAFIWRTEPDNTPNPSHEYWRKRGEQIKHERMIDDEIRKAVKTCHPDYIIDESKMPDDFLKKHGEIDNIYYEIEYEPTNPNHEDDSKTQLSIIINNEHESYNTNDEVIKGLSLQDKDDCMDIDYEGDNNLCHPNDCNDALDYRFSINSCGEYERDENGLVKLNIIEYNLAPNRHNLPPEESIILREVNEVVRGIYLEENCT